MNKLNEILDIESEDSKLPLVPQKDCGDADLDTDIRFVRSNMYDLIEKGQYALDELISIANQSQHPRSYEVLSTLIKTLSDTNSELLKVHDKSKKQNNENNITNNNLFVGSTEELQKMIRGEK